MVETHIEQAAWYEEHQNMDKTLPIQSALTRTILHLYKFQGQVMMLDMQTQWSNIEIEKREMLQPDVQLQSDNEELEDEKPFLGFDDGDIEVRLPDVFKDMETQWCDIEIKTEDDLDIVDVQMTCNDDEEPEDDKPFLGFDDNEVDVKLRNFYKEQTDLEAVESIIGDAEVKLKNSDNGNNRPTFSGLKRRAEFSERKKTIINTGRCTNIYKNPQLEYNTLKDNNSLCSRRSKEILFKQRILRDFNKKKFVCSYYNVLKKKKLKSRRKKLWKRNSSTSECDKGEDSNKKIKKDPSGVSPFTVKDSSFVNNFESAEKLDENDSSVNNRINSVQETASKMVQNSFENKVQSSLHNCNKFKCDECKFETEFYQEFKSHQYTHSNSRDFACSQCEYRCKEEHMLNVHMRTHTGEKPYKCLICDFQCSFPSTFANHKKIHSHRKPFSCNKCDFSTKSKFSFQRHKENMHEQPKISCKECDYKCSSQLRLNNHMIIHSGKNYFECSHCDYKHSIQGVVRRHMVMHMENREQLSCVKCYYKGVQPQYVIRHVEKHHGSELKVESSDHEVVEAIECNSLNGVGSNCSKNETSKITVPSEDADAFVSNLVTQNKQPIVRLRRCDENEDSNNKIVDITKLHEKMLQSRFHDIVSCNEPLKETSSLSNISQQKEDCCVILQNTLTTKSNNSIVSIVKCVEKSKSSLPVQVKRALISGNKKNLIRRDSRNNLVSQPDDVIHVNEVTFKKCIKDESMMTGKVFLCASCTFSTTDMSKLEKHVNIHKEGNLSCKLCNFITNSRTSLYRHRQLKHSKVKQFKCTKCKYECAIYQYLKNHMKSHEDVKRFVCDKCDYSCKSALALKTHMFKHSGEKPYACDLCDYRSTLKHSIKIHRFVHTGETKHFCNICNFKCPSASNLKRHMTVHSVIS